MWGDLIVHKLNVWKSFSWLELIILTVNDSEACSDNDLSNKFGWEEEDDETDLDLAVLGIVKPEKLKPRH